MSDMFTSRLRSEIPHCLKYFVDALAKDKQLESVNFGDNAFGPDGITPLVPLIAANTQLKVLKLNNTGLGPRGGCILADALTQLHQSCVKAQVESQLQTVVCGRSRLENESMHQLGTALGLHSKLTELSLPQDGVRPEGIMVLLPLLAKCTNLQILDLQDNTFTARGARALAAVLDKWPHLRHLNVGDCMLTSAGAVAVMRTLCDSPLAAKL